ncbi:MULTISPECIES: N-acetyltransferase family protein [unclassified Pseudactinotalea]|uniref:GNAT family N-acetyltransferase n=1 Tax=unclassified Pseudactinotalea TaxID=2649176 RepID=UPI003C7BDE06
MTEQQRQGTIGVRDAGPEDAEFLIDMLLEAVNWTGEERMKRRQLLRDKTLSHYVAGWQRAGDLGVIAVDTGGPAGLQIPIGAAWLRRFDSHHPGYGYVADDVPELSIGVAQQHRRRGIGSGLLRTLFARAEAAGIRRVSVSVEDGNPSESLFAAAGFTVVGRNGNADTMVLDLSAADA